MITNSILHYTLIRGIINKGFAPSVDDLCEYLDSSKEEIIRGLYELQEYHGVVLHPNEPKVWVLHPFSLAPTNFYVTSSKGEWWGNCAWCSLGIATLLKTDITISTAVGGETKPIEINIVGGLIQEKSYYIHFPIAMQNAWDNVIYTCSNMLIFENVKQIDKWSLKHNIPRGDVQPIEKIWEFAKKWYGDHLNPEWKKWTTQEAKEIFEEFELTHDIWQLNDSGDRF